MQSHVTEAYFDVSSLRMGCLLYKETVSACRCQGEEGGFGMRRVKCMLLSPSCGWEAQALVVGSPTKVPSRRGSHHQPHTLDNDMLIMDFKRLKLEVIKIITHTTVGFCNSEQLCQ